MSKLTTYQDVSTLQITPKQMLQRIAETLLYHIRIWNTPKLSLEQRLQSAKDAQLLCSAVIEHMNEDLPQKEFALFLNIFRNATLAFSACERDEYISLKEVQKALLTILALTEKS